MTWDEFFGRLGVVCPDHSVLGRRPVTSKAEMYEDLSLGCFGNHQPHYFSVAAWEEAEPLGKREKQIWAIRSMDPWKGKFVGDLHASEVAEAVASRTDRWTIVGQTDNRVRLLNAELTLAPDPHLYYSTVPRPMRESLEKGGRSVRGAAAWAVVDALCDPNSATDLRDLGEQYPYHAIEFTAYDAPIGCFPGRKTLVWEVRAGY